MSRGVRLRTSYSIMVVLSSLSVGMMDYAHPQNVKGCQVEELLLVVLSSLSVDMVEYTHRQDVKGCQVEDV